MTTFLPRADGVLQEPRYDDLNFHYLGGLDMASAEIDSGICGFCTTVRTASDDGRTVRLEFETTCEHVQKLAEHLQEVDAYQEISYRGEGPLTFQLSSQYLVHPACPVPSGIIKAVEVQAELAFPKDARITPSKD